MSDICPVCFMAEAWKHDHKQDKTGLDDGPYLDGMRPRKKMEPKPASIVSEIRKRAWDTRRQKYGVAGHR